MKNKVLAAALLCFCISCAEKKETKPRRVLNVLDFGANPNDTLDDTKAIQLAFDSAHDGDEIVIPEGVFIVSPPLTFDTTNGSIRILGKGILKENHGK